MLAEQDRGPAKYKLEIRSVQAFVEMIEKVLQSSTEELQTLDSMKAMMNNAYCQELFR
jgi:hypothetical protein